MSQSLEDSQEKIEILNSLLEKSHVAVICLDADGLVRVWNPEAARILGWTREERIERRLPLELRVLEEGQKDETEGRLPTKQGGEVHVDVQTALWRDRSSRTGKLFMLLDLTPVREMAGNVLEAATRIEQAHQEVRASRRFRELLEAAPDAIIEVDRDGRIVLLNRGTEKLFGYTREELLGQPVEVLVPAAARARHHHHRENYRAHPATRPMGIGLTLEGCRKDGSRFPVEISLSPAESEEGFRVTAIIRDVSERKNAEDALRAVQEKYNLELNERNQELERANRLKSEFLASMSHELRTPLHTVIGFAELLGEQMEGPLNDKQQRFIQHIHKDALHLLELINDILDLSKIESGRLSLRPEVFEFSTVLEESLSSVAPQAQAKSLQIEKDVASPLPLEADRLRIKQVLVNLLSNAVKFTPEGGRIRISARPENSKAVISVSDTGIGIPKDEHESVFDKFYQVSATTKGIREGTGLGLAITKHLVEEHGGEMYLESEPGRGSTFTFTLPLQARQKGGDAEWL